MGMKPASRKQPLPRCSPLGAGKAHPQTSQALRACASPPSLPRRSMFYDFYTLAAALFLPCGSLRRALQLPPPQRRAALRASGHGTYCWAYRHQLDAVRARWPPPPWPRLRLRLIRTASYGLMLSSRKKECAGLHLRRYLACAPRAGRRLPPSLPRRTPVCVSPPSPLGGG